MFKKWVERIGLVSFSLVAILLSLGCLYQSVSTKIDDKNYSPSGKLVDIGGYRLHINCKGKGRQAVILEAGMGCNSIDWILVQPEVAKFTQVCSYDRAGNGWSDESPLERTSQNIVYELHALLKNAGISGPYILVGHSFGGINVRLFASTYPNEVAGLVLVDASHEDQFEKISWPKSSFVRLLMNTRVATFAASIGVVRILNHLPQYREELKTFPFGTQQMYLSRQSTTKFIKTLSQEFVRFAESLKQLKNAGGFLGNNKPLIVLSAGKTQISNEAENSQTVIDKRNQTWQLLQKDLVTKSTNGKRIIAEHSGHMITRDQPEIIIEAIREEVNSNQIR